MPRKKTKQILGLGNLSSPYKEDLNLSRKKSKKMKKSSIEKHDIDNVAYSDNNEDICTVCKKTGRVLCCDNCFRSFHESCSGQFRTFNGAWRCPNCCNLDRDLCKNCGKRLILSSKTLPILLQCNVCGGNIHKECTNVPIELIVTTETNLNYFFNKNEKTKILKNYFTPQRKETVNEVLMNILKSKNGQKFAFHICSSCINISKSATLLSKTELDGVIYLKIKYKNLSDIHEFWLHNKNIPRLLNEPIPYSKPLKFTKVDRIVSWHRPLSLSKKNYLEMFNFFKQRKSDILKSGTINSLYFLVKWEGRDYNESTWEDEFFLKSSYNKILEYAYRKAREYLVTQGKSFDRISLMNFRGEDVKGGEYTVRESNSVEFSHNQLEDIKLLTESFRAKNDIIVKSRNWIRPQIMGLLGEVVYRSEGFEPSLVICKKESIQKWKEVINLYLPRLNYVDYSIFNEAEDFISRYEFYSGNRFSIKFDVLFVSYESFEFYSKYLMPINWKMKVIEIEDYHHKISSIFKILNISEKSTQNYKLLVVKESEFSSRNMIGANKGDVMNSIYNKINSIRYTSEEAYKQVISLECFKNCNFQMVEFYLNSKEMFTNKLNSFDLERLKLLDKKMNNLREKISLNFQLSGLSDIKLACEKFNIVLQLSRDQKVEYRSSILNSIDMLMKVDEGRVRNRTRSKLLKLIKTLLEISNESQSKVDFRANNLLKANSKLNWTFKFLKNSFKSSGSNKRFVIILNSKLIKLGYSAILSTCKEFSIFQIDFNNSTKQINTLIHQFNNTVEKIPIFLIEENSFHLLENLQSDFFIITNFNENLDYKKIIWRSLDKSIFSCPKIVQLLSEGVEEKISKYQNYMEMDENQLNKILKYKFNSLKIFNENVSFVQSKIIQGYVLGEIKQIPPEFENEKIYSHYLGEERAGNDQMMWKYTKKTIYYDVLKDELLELKSWKEIKDEFLNNSKANNTASNEKEPETGEVVLRKRTMKLETSTEVDKRQSQNFNDDDELEVYLKKRFISSRFEKQEELPTPEVLYSVDFEKRVNLIDFILRFGIYFDSLIDFYKKFCLQYPESCSQSPNEFHFFKQFIREFIFSLALKNKKCFRNNIIFSGLNQEDMYNRVVGVTIINKLVKKYSNRPELFFNEEYVELPSDHIPIRENKTYDYSNGKWNNFDDFCLMKGISKHGFGHIDMIIMDEKIWEKQLGDREELIVNKIHHILMKKINSDHYFELKNKVKIKQVVFELLKRKSFNLLNLVYEYRNKIRI